MRGVSVTAAALLVLGVASLTSARAAAAEPPSEDQPAPAGDPRPVVGPPRGRPVAGVELEARTRHVASLLRCPVCQGLSVADSPSTTAQKMKGQVREMVAAGYEQDQILAYFETSYGAFVRLEPPLRGVNWLVWLAPILGLAAGGGIVAWALRAPGRREQRPAGPGGAEVGRSDQAGSASHAVGDEPPPLPGPDTLPDDSRLAAYVLRVREAVYGWPGGRFPAPKPDLDRSQAAPGAANPS